MAFVTPKKTIEDVAALQRFLESPTCAKYVAFLEELNESVKGLHNDSSVTSSEVLASSILFFGNQRALARPASKALCPVFPWIYACPRPFVSQ